ncbi:V-type ATP synthase subunit I domain-containing protein [Sinomicrobium soli]|uniref:hypothetical protein n=1 Tax=Sinomicrobium sp. N-1-3-6 TaxID=2219864 RepID=UPI000DCDF5A3|nr:hypothetical protein [Sinomicrobium sp. N-1-3-6]RAV27545.1 hypothetical protein DN748_17810 [Sinomicrobium sp. N-1-3-6]
MSQNNQPTRNQFLKFLSDWGLFTISLIIIISYTVFSSLPEKNNTTIWVNILFVVLNLLAAFYISRQVALWGWQTDNAANQKRIAKTAIRHNRANLSSIIKLIKIVKEKTESVKDPLIFQYLKEIQNHLEILYNGIKNSEADFYEIVNEELQEQNVLEIEISEILEQKEVLKNELKSTKAEGERYKETIQTLKKAIREKEYEVLSKASELPFGQFSISPDSPLNDMETNFWNSKESKDLIKQISDSVANLEFLSSEETKE